MYAVVRKLFYDPKKLAQADKQMQEFDALHAAQPGYRGNMVVDAGDGRMVVLNLWESEAHAQAALGVMVPVVQRLIEPLMTAPAELVASGDLVKNDLPLDRAA